MDWWVWIRGRNEGFPVSNGLDTGGSRIVSDCGGRFGVV